MRKQILILFAIYLTAFASYAQAPTITSFSPVSGPVGTLVTITGTNLDSPTAFTIGGVSAIVVSDSDTTLVGLVMPGAVTGSVSVTTSGGGVTANDSFVVTSTPYPFAQQGPKLTGTGAVGSFVEQGFSVSISADGNTAIVGGPGDDSLGAAWIYTRSGGTWTQLGSKLQGIGALNQGTAVAISADGKTAMIAGDSSSHGAVLAFTGSGSTWVQQGPLLIGTGASTLTNTGVGGLALSADGNTAILGGPFDSADAGAVWIFVRSGGIWSQQGGKLVGTGVSNTFNNGAEQGYSVAISADGNTVMVGGPYDNNNLGAAWIYTRSGGIWTQQGSKLVGTGATLGAGQGSSVALSADGNTALSGAYDDSTSIGAAWIFTRSSGNWTQEGTKLIGSGAKGSANQGASACLSADGNTAVVGGPSDSSNRGAAWVFTRGDSTWIEQGHKLVGNGARGFQGFQGYSISLSSDGSTMIVGGYGDSIYRGAAWIFSNNPCSSSYAISQAICQGDTFELGSEFFTMPGTYIDTITSLNGCDSIVTLTLTVNPLPVVTLSWQALVQQHDLYGDLLDTFWSCTNSPDNFSMVGGVPAGGNYSGKYIENNTFIFNDSLGIGIDTVTYVYTDSNGCVGRALDSFDLPCIQGINSISAANAISLYPNPNTGTFTLQTSQMQNATYTISDMLGQVVQRETITSDNQVIDIGAVPAGIYMLSISGLSGSVRFAVMR